MTKFDSKNHSVQDHSPEITLPLRWVNSIVTCFCEIPLAAGSKYESVEIQNVSYRNLAGLVAVLHVEPGVIDVLFEPALQLDRAWTTSEPATAHMTVRNLESTLFKDSICHVTSHETNVHAEFLDPDGDLIEFEVKYKQRNSIESIFVPAPRLVQENPVSLRFLILDTFYLLPRGTEISVKINSETQAIKYFLLPKVVAPYTAGRSGADLLLTSLVFSEKEQPDTGGQSNQAIPVRNSSKWMELKAIPDRINDRAKSDAVTTSGKIEVNSSLGIIATGLFKQESRQENVQLELTNVQQNWNPSKTSLTRRVLALIRSRKRAHENWRFCATGTLNSQKIRFSKGVWKC